MAKYIPDVKTQRWVIVAPQRTDRPDQREQIDTAVCPFCAGRETLTPPEVYRIGGGGKNAQGWLVRVVPNKYPITDTHEVIIHSPDCNSDIETLPLDQVVRILTAYRDRYRAHEGDGQVLIFCNHGVQAGASIKHPHSQLVVVPKQISLDALEREPVANIVSDNTHFITYCPEFSQWPYEVWIAPKDGGIKFSDTNDEQLKDLATLLQSSLRGVQMVATQMGMRPKEWDGQFMYNFYIYHAANWFLRIIPRLVHRAGFELGTGLNVNVVDPAEAAKELREWTMEIEHKKI